MTKTTKQKVDEWLEKAPKEIRINFSGISVNKRTISSRMVGDLTPTVIEDGYHINISIDCDKWN